MFGLGGEGAHAVEKWVGLSDTDAVRPLAGRHGSPDLLLTAAAAREFHPGLAGYAPTPVRELPDVAAELGLGAVLVKDESNRLNLPAFKVLGASWAVERALREAPGTHTLVAASAGYHGRAVAHVARLRGLGARVFLPERSLLVRREAIASEGAEMAVVDGTYEESVAAAEAAATEPGALLISDVGDSGPAHWVINGYSTLFAEAASQARYDSLVVPVGVGALAAAAARHGAEVGVRVIGVEPEAAACLTASLGAGRPVAVETPGTTMAGLDCAEVSPAAWSDLSTGIHGTVTVSYAEAAAAMDELAAHGLAIGESDAAPLAGLRKLTFEGAVARVLLVATEGRTGAGAEPLDA